VGTLVVLTSRTLATAGVAFFVVRLLRDFELERAEQLKLAVEERLRAQTEALEAQRKARSEVERWTRQLEDLVDSIASAMSKGTPLEELLTESLEKVLELTRFDAGDILLVQEGEPELQLASEIGLPELTQECRLVLRPGADQLRAVHAASEAASVRSLCDDAELADGSCARAGFQCLARVPVVCRGNLLGVMNLLGRCEPQPQPNELRVLSAIGQQIGVAIERARLYEKVQSVAAMEERERLSRELHDGLAQVLGYLYLKSHSVGQLLSSGELAAAQAELNEIRDVARETQRDVREAILGLRTTITPETGIVPTLTEYVRRFTRQSGIHTNLVASAGSMMEFEPIVEIQLLRIVQEALTNTRKHSGATGAWIRFESDGNLAMISIEDNGRGFDPQHIRRDDHYGLATMRERAQSVGGDVRIRSEPGQGTQVKVWLPPRGLRQ
jgi:signal transduction histidine kinase